MNGTVPDVVRVLILFNPISGSGRSARLASELAVTLERLAEEDGCPLEIEQAETRPEPAEHWLDARLDSIELLVVVGGDGAMRLAAPAAMRCRVPVYHYPGGTENLFARDFGMQATPEALFSAIREGETRSIDVAWADGELVLVCASIGLDAEVSRDLAEHRSGSISHLSYLPPLLRQVRRWRARPPAFEGEVDGGLLGPSTSGLVIVANSRQYALRLDPVHMADHLDGAIDVVQLPARTLLGLLVWIIRCRLRRQFRSRQARHARGLSVVVRSDRPSTVQIDGDPAFDGAPRELLRVVVEPAALQVLSPPVRESASRSAG